MTKYEVIPGTEVKVRLGVPDDVHEAMKLALMACEENSLSRADPTKLLNHLWAALNQDHGICGVIGEPGQPLEGIVLLRVGALWYAPEDDNILEEKAIFIHPDFRSAKGGRAARLCEFSKWLSDELHMPLSIGVLSSARTAAKTRMYQRYFGEPMGAYWVYNGATGEQGPVVDHISGIEE